MNKSTVSLTGVLPPIPTPFDNQGEVSHEALAENLKRWNEFDLAGYVVAGSNGEAAYLTAREKLQILETARQVIPADKLMVAGTGGESTRQTIALTLQAAEAGADAALVLTPHYFNSLMTPDSLAQHYKAIADASPIPVLIYNVPKFTGVDVDAATVTRIARHPNIIGMKDSGGNVAKIADVVRRTGPDFHTLAGSAGFFLAGLTIGAVGGVMALANIAPQACIDMYCMFKAARWDKAAELQRRMIPVNSAVTARFGVAGLKAAMDMLGYYGGPVRPPLLDLSKSAVQALREILVAGKLL